MGLRGILRHFLTPSFLRYLLVGGFGFLVDAGGMEALFHGGMEVHAARVFSMTFAIGCTYMLHRNFSFRGSKSPAKTSRQLGAFVVVQLAAAALNYGIFCLGLWVIQVGPPLLNLALPWPQDVSNLLSLAAGVGAGLIFNFVLLRLFVFPAGDEPAYNAVQDAGAMRAHRKRVLWRSAVWVFFIAAMAMTALGRQTAVLSFPNLISPLPPADPDVWMRLTEVRQWLSGTFFDHGVHNTNAPVGGVTTPWTRPLDMLLSLFYFLTPAGLSMNVRLMLAATWLPPCLCVASVAIIAAAAQRHFRHAQVLTCAVLLMLVNANVYAYFSPGDSDHHGLLSMLWCGVIFFIADGVLPLYEALAAGVLLGVMVWTSPEALILTALVYALLGAEALFKPEKGAVLAATAIGAAVAATAGLFVEVPPDDIFTRLTYDSLSIVQVALLWLTAGSALWLALLFRQKLPLAARFCGAALGGGFVLLAMKALYPRFFLGPMADADPFIFTDFLPHIGEAIPLFGSAHEDILREVMEPALAALLLLFALCGKNLRPKKRRYLLVLATVLGATFLLTAFQIRWSYYLQPPAIAAAAALLPGMAGAARAKLTRWTRAAPRLWRPYIWLWLIYMAVTLAVRAVPTKVPEVASCMAQARYVIQKQELQALLGDKNSVFFTHEDVGGDILFFTPFRVIASNYHREGKGLADMKKIAAAPTPEAAHAIIKERQVSAMLYCPTRYRKTSWLRKMAEDGKYPKWLKPVDGLALMEIPGPQPVLLKVTP